jgi:DNA-directed RNA polymerase specialized sigma24 family protein
MEQAVTLPEWMVGLYPDVEQLHQCYENRDPQLFDVARGCARVLLDAEKRANDLPLPIPEPEPDPDFGDLFARIWRATRREKRVYLETIERRIAPLFSNPTADDFITAAEAVQVLVVPKFGAIAEMLDGQAMPTEKESQAASETLQMAVSAELVAYVVRYEEDEWAAAYYIVLMTLLYLHTLFGPVMVMPLLRQDLDDGWREQVAEMVAQVWREAYSLATVTSADVFATAQECVEKWRETLRVLKKELRLDRKPGGTGRKREHEVVESKLISDEEPPPLELIPDLNTPDPAKVVADEDALECVLAQFGERTAQLLRLLLKGYSEIEAARQLGIAPATARKLKERAKKKIEKYLKNRL